jgi:hypothetical protein
VTRASSQLRVIEEWVGGGDGATLEAAMDHSPTHGGSRGGGHVLTRSLQEL